MAADVVQYNVVFDVIQSGHRNWPGPVFGLIFVAIGVCLVYFRSSDAPRARSWFSFGFLGFAIVWTLVVLVGTVADYLTLAAALRDGRCEVVEGVVSEFHPMPESGHEMEWFVVGGRRFEYSDFVIVAGFNNTSSHGGPIRKGIRVRVHHRGNDIAKLEVAQ